MTPEPRPYYPPPARRGGTASEDHDPDEIGTEPQVSMPSIRLIVLWFVAAAFALPVVLMLWVAFVAWCWRVANSWGWL